MTDKILMRRRVRIEDHLRLARRLSTIVLISTRLANTGEDMDPGSDLYRILYQRERVSCHRVTKTGGRNTARNIRYLPDGEITGVTRRCWRPKGVSERVAHFSKRREVVSLRTVQY